LDSSISDRNLADAMHKGSKQAFEAIYLKYHRMLYSIAFRYLSSAEDAEDATADVFVHLWEIRREMIVETSLRNFLYTMMKNHIITFNDTPLKDVLEKLERWYDVSFETGEDGANIYSLTMNVNGSLDEALQEIAKVAPLVFKIKSNKQIKVELRK
jgi:RNA polymerase sigma factor (sigma-70 family)